MADDEIKDDNTKGPAKNLALRLREIADEVEKDIFDHGTGSFAESLVEILEAIAANRYSCAAILLVGEDTCIDDWATSDEVSPPMVFELAGRLQGMATRLSMLASHEEHTSNEDHTGHGCPQDPGVKAKNTN